MLDNDFSTRLIEMALAEDLGTPGDLTSHGFVPDTATGSGRIFAKQSMTVSGLCIAERVFRSVNPTIEVNLVASDGDQVEYGDTLLTFSGKLQSILTAERTALNFLGRLSGVATLTTEYVSLVEGTAARILDTRKTTPGWRVLEKQAVAHGGGTNHRMGLYDAVMVKDNHLLATPEEELPGMITRFLEKHPGVKVQFEADTLHQVQRFLGYEGISSILLDNMSPDQLREAVRLRDELKPAVLLEASGGVNLKTVQGIAETGVDFISVGALTHSAVSVDVSLELASS